MWSRYDPGVVREELAILADHGLNVTRSFCFWPDFVPTPGLLDPDVAERFADFLDAHVEVGLGTIPTFVVGHMSGENWDPAWRQGRDLYRDVWLVSQQAWLAAEIAGRFGQHPAVVGWLVSNEMPLYGGAGDERGDHRLGPAGRAGRPLDRRHPADLARRRGVGCRGVRERQRLLVARARAARRLRRAPRLSDAGRRGTAGPDRSVRLRARRAASASPSCSRSSASPPTSPPMTQRPTTTGRSCTRPCLPVHGAGSHGTTATTTTCEPRIRIVITGSRCTSA